MFGLGKGVRKKYQDQLEELAQTWQMGVYKRLSDQYQIVVPTTNEDNARIIVAAITNWVFRFGDYGPKVAGNPALKPNVDAALPNCARALGNEDDLAEITLAVIIAAAAQNTPMPMFTTNFDKLAALGIVKRNINLYVPMGSRPVHIGEFLRGQHREYYRYMQYGVE
jgi:hypothetical protein